MVQRQLPMFPEGSLLVTGDLAVEKREGRISYYYGTLPVFTHDENDDVSFQMITAQFYCNGYVKQMDIVRAFGVTPISVKRAVKRYQEQGVQGFYAPKNTWGAAVLTDEVLQVTQQLLSEGQEPCDVADQLNIKHDTFRPPDLGFNINILGFRLNRFKINEQPMGIGIKSISYSKIHQIL